MKKWVILEDNKVICLGMGTDTEYYKNNGFQYLDVEESEKGGWYLAGTAPKLTEKEIIEKKYIDDKEARDKSINELSISFNGKIFQADETSQIRMLKAILSLENNESIQWITKDNQIVTLTKEQLTNIFKKIIKEQTNIWLKPLQNKLLK